MKNRILALALAIMLLCSTFAAFAAKEATVVLPETYRALTVRSATNTSSKPTAYVHDGDDITVLKKGKTWSRIRVEDNNRVGYIKNMYISGAKRPRKTFDWGHVSADYVTAPLRARRSGKSLLLADLRRYAKLQLLSRSRGWYKVRTSSDVTGYVAAKFVTKGARKTAKADLTIREKPNGEEVTMISKGDYVKALAQYGDWTYVHYLDEDVYGYVFAMCLK
ncbi:MAG: SH3 domain-containing protein [Christensenellales bacterium]